MSLDQLFPEGKQVTISGEIVTVKPFRFTKVKQVSTLLNSVVPEMVSQGLIVFENGEFSITPQWPVRIASVLSGIGEDVFKLCELAIDKDREFLDKAEMDEGANLVLAILMVNVDFFRARILAGLAAMMDTVRTGSTPSILSSQPDTADPT